MTPKWSIILLVVTVSLLSDTESKSLNVCPNEHLADVLMGSAWIQVSSVQHASLVRRVRLPQEGLFDEPITCLLASDTSEDDSGGHVEITDGGINHKFVEVRMNSQIGKGLDYLIMVYTAQHSAITYEINNNQE